MGVYQIVQLRLVRNYSGMLDSCFFGLSLSNPSTFLPPQRSSWNETSNSRVAGRGEDWRYLEHPSGENVVSTSPESSRENLILSGSTCTIACHNHIDLSSSGLVLILCRSGYYLVDQLHSPYGSLRRPARNHFGRKLWLTVVLWLDWAGYLDLLLALAALFWTNDGYCGYPNPFFAAALQVIARLSYVWKAR